MAEDELPSFRNYVREHSFQQIIDRFTYGFRAQLTNIIMKPFSVTNYWIGYMYILLVGIMINFKKFRKLNKTNVIPIMFVILYYLGYLIAFAWYCPIACGRRFTFALYLPFIITVFMLIKELTNSQTKEIEKVENQIDLAKFFSASNVIVAFSLIFNIWIITNEVLYFDVYGS